MGSHEQATRDLEELLEDGSAQPFQEFVPFLPHDHPSHEPQTGGGSSLYEWFVDQVQSQVVDRSPFKRLCYALLVEAISDLQRPLNRPDGRVDVVARRDHTRAKNWFLNEAAEGEEEEEFSFPDVCQILFGEDTDPSRLRVAILKKAEDGSFNIRELLVWNS